MRTGFASCSLHPRTSKSGVARTGCANPILTPPDLYRGPHATPPPRVRHEAGEALGAIGRPECLAALRAHAQDPAQEVAETCQLALERIEYLQQHPDGTRDGESPYMSVDPTPPFPVETPMEQLRSILLDPKQRMFDVRGDWGWGAGGWGEGWCEGWGERAV